MRNRSITRIIYAASIALMVAGSAGAQQTATVTAADYARAERFLRDNVLPLVSGMRVQPFWLANDRFVYRIGNASGQNQFALVDPARGTRVACSPETDRCGGALDPREVSRLQSSQQRGPAGGGRGVSPRGRRAPRLPPSRRWGGAGP